jgi:hypothetical protein
LRTTASTSTASARNGAVSAGSMLMFQKFGVAGSKIPARSRS